MQTISADRLSEARNDRRALEVAVAQTIGNYLLAHKREHIRGLILSMLDKMVGLFHQGFVVSLRAGSILMDQKSFGMWDQVNVNRTEEGLDRIYDYVRWWNNYDWLKVCSDVIRLFGEMSEDDMISRLPDDAWQTMAKKGDLRPEPIYAQPGKKANEKIGWGHRDRNNKDNPVRIDAPFVALHRKKVKWRGVEKFQFGDHSVVKTIDYTYGLQIEGGDISGTTTDSIAALSWASSAGGADEDPIAQLIAIATMVPQGHHTIVECAWPLTRQGYMDYCIGFYDTLVPKGDDYAGLTTALQNANNDGRNRHLFVFAGSAGMPQNFLFEKPDEIAEYKKIAGVRRAYGICVAGKLDRRGAENVMRSHGVSDLVMSRMSYWG